MDPHYSIVKYPWLGVWSFVKILVAEDTKQVQDSLEVCFAEWNFEADMVGTGLEAVEKAAANQYDLILMDIQMPGLNGYEAAVKIRKGLNKNTPIIALTASANEKRSLEAGMNCVVEKPFNPDFLKARIEEWAVGA